MGTATEKKRRARSRRRNGEGSVSRRADGRWMGQLWCGHYPNGRPRIVSVYGATERDALKKLREVRRRLDENKSPTVSRRTLADFAAEFFVGAEQRLKGSTLKFYRDNWINHLNPRFGKRPVASLTRDDAVTLVRSLRQQGMSLAATKGVKATLSVMLDEAMELGLRSDNPALRMGKHLRIGKDTKSAPDPFSRDEAGRLLATARQHFPRWHGFIAAGLLAGFRIGELLALEWGDIDWRAKTIRVARNLVRGEVTSPKSHSERLVDMDHGLELALRWHRRMLAKEFREIDAALPPYVFASYEGTRLDESNSRKMLTKVCLAAGLRRRSPHDLRHSYASLLIADGAPITYVSHQLGHADASITAKVYAHWLPASNARYSVGLSVRSRNQSRNHSQTSLTALAS